ncbi:uncharacterized protein CXQ87_001423 [Candidozyma duobushaemuli]|uniref:Zn(2)-C6 fungal-type domain-containing protein n=2 Tax=Candidozyma TaxID=3303203 RepID=A0ABX8I1C5_9ASCO|nr:uncharacterized protein CXQ87_001423 [[Candida] duobushaemulonis]PVH18493.1 hypothetical protein CXQ87_001423 [[Candida] duobushaemulonis]QWU87021.1 hypothetical protein CA3LBN_001239 [[Candida] haemuloni]
MDGPPRKKHKDRSAAVVGISRSIAACQRCRSKKIKCDQNFPKCSKCERAGLECVGIDPATGREVPRSYVYHLEEKVQRLEALLRQKGLDPSGEEESPASASVSVASEPVGPMGVTFAKLMVTANRMNMGPSDSSASVPVDVSPAILPPKKTAMEFIRIFFAQSNSQLPVLHRETFLRDIFIPVYGAWDENVSLASDYSAFNRSCYDDSIMPDEQTWLAQYKQAMQASLSGDQDPARASSSIPTPEGFRKPLFFLNIIFAISSSTNHLQYHTHMSESFKEAAMRHVDATYSTADSLEQLEAVLLQTLYSVMRPNVPGVWYLLGTALRLCVDMGLHKEEHPKAQTMSAFTKDRRRRLFWSTYSIDRQMCFYLGRPVGIPEESITARLPSELDDAFIDPSDNNTRDYSDNSGGMASCKTITLSFFKVRQIQSECQRILYENGELPRRFSNLAQWKAHISEELELWRARCPKKSRKMNCEFNTEFFDLNYYHTLLLINGLSKKTFQLAPDAYFKVLEASKGLMACYSKLYHKKAINYTWAAVHNLFMAGTSYLFVLYNSEQSRSSNSADEVKVVTEDCLSVLASLVASCTAAKSCMDTFSMLTAVVLKLRYDVAVEGTMVGISKHQLDSVSGTGSLKGNLASLVEGIANESEKSQQEASHDSPRFGWVSREAFEPEPRTYEQALPTPMMPETHLEDFFLELENLSPVSSIREPTNMDLTISNELPSGQNRDGKRVFELIQQMPTEPIWDQFFGRSMAPSFKQEPTTP